MLEELFHFEPREWIYKLGGHHRIKIAVGSSYRNVEATIWIWGEAGWGKLLAKWEYPPRGSEDWGMGQLEEHARDRAVEYAIRFIDG